MTLFVGQKITLVAPVDPGWPAYAKTMGYIIPEFGVVYTLRCFSHDGDALRLNEIHNKEYRYGDGTYEPSWRTAEWRPAVAKETDISIFTEMLNPALIQRLLKESCGND